MEYKKHRQLGLILTSIQELGKKELVIEVLAMCFFSSTNWHAFAAKIQSIAQPMEYIHEGFDREGRSVEQGSSLSLSGL